MRPRAGHRNAEKANGLARTLCLYDNAGEHFQPGQDTTSSPVTRHIAHSRAILFLFDPTQDRRFRAICRSREVMEVGTTRDHRLSRQETILNEAAARIRKHMGLSHHAKYERPMIVVLSKSDEWSHLVQPREVGEPWKPDGSMAVIDHGQVDTRSDGLRRLLANYCPETVAAIEGFASDVTYVAVSALGDRVEINRVTGLPGIRPKDIEPCWVTVPLLYSISKFSPGLIPRLKRKGT
jgi:hypothetical protein